MRNIKRNFARTNLPILITSFLMLASAILFFSRILIPNAFFLEVILGVGALGIGYMAASVNPSLQKMAARMKTLIGKGMKNMQRRLRNRPAENVSQPSNAVRLPSASNVESHLGDIVPYSGSTASTQSQATQPASEKVSIFSRIWGVTKKIPYWSKLVATTAVATIIPPKPFIRLAKVLPIGGWLEHVPYKKGEPDELSYSVIFRNLQFVKDVIEVLPRDAFHRMMNNTNWHNQTPLYLATRAADEPVAKFRTLLEAIDPERRLEYLTKIVGTPETGIGPLIHQLNYTRAIACWDVAMELLNASQRKELARTKDQMGDSLLYKVIDRYGPEAALKIFEPLSIEERKQYLCEVCPHGKNPAVKIFQHWKLHVAINIIPILPIRDWQEVFNFTPIGWTMTLGEKIVFMMNAVGTQDERDTTVKYFNDNFDIKLPERYENLSRMEKSRILKEIREGNYDASCEPIHNFSVKYGATPVSLLGMTEPNLEPGVYIRKFHELMLRHHPDKNNGKPSDKFEGIIAAKEFIISKERRCGYFSPSTLGNIITTEIDSSGECRFAFKHSTPAKT